MRISSRFAILRRRAMGRLTALLIGFGLLGAAAPGFAEPQKYLIDPDHLTVSFLVTHIGYAKTLGMFRKASGEFTFDEATGQLSNLRVVVDTDSVFTNHDKRDEHVRSKDFLNIKEFPEMSFTAARATRTGERNFEVPGELTLLGKTKPLTLTATWNKSDVYAIPAGPLKTKPYVIGVSARGSLKRSEYGMSYAVANGLVSDDIELLIELEASRQ